MPPHSEFDPVSIKAKKVIQETEKALKKSVSAQIPKAHQIMKQAASEQHLPTSLQEVLLATTVYELELIRIGLDKLTRRLDSLPGPR